MVVLNPCGLTVTGKLHQQPIQINVVALLETKTNFSKINEVSNPIKALIRKQWAASKLTTSISADPSGHISIYLYLLYIFYVLHTMATFSSWDPAFFAIAFILVRELYVLPYSASHSS